ncbi:MAG: adenylate/guanylate cyclase domain-containing protein, partial [bacterium]|nr:adenylate/guanylate cyclase domain-containing protein [bacterium]
MKFKQALSNRFALSVGLSIIAFCIVTVLGLLFPRQFQEWEEKSLDYRFRLRPAVQESPFITRIGIDDRSLDAVGVWPWDRSIHARMLKLLTELGTSAINLDIIFPRKSSEEGDALFLERVEQAENIILSAPFQLIDHPCFTPQEYVDFLERFPQTEEMLHPLKAQNRQGNICIDVEKLSDEQLEQLDEQAYLELVMSDEFIYISEDDQRRVEEMLQHFQYPFSIQGTGKFWYANRTLAPMEGLSRAAYGLGHISATPDSDGVFRRVPLVIRVQEQLFPSLAFAAALKFLEVDPQNVVLVPGKHILLRQAKFPDSSALKDIHIPVDDRFQLRVNYPKQQNAHSFVDILESKDNPEQFKHLKTEFQKSVCTIGYISTGTGDIGPNPLETNYSLAFIHSAILNTILTENFLHDTKWYVNFGITLILLLFMSFIFHRLSPLHFTLAMFLMIAGYIVLSLFLFNVYGIILQLIHPVVMTLILAYTLIILYWYATEERERKHLRSAFRTYVSRQMLTRILDNPKSLTLSGQRKELTIMFSDIRQFSTLSDKIEPEVIHRLLNMYFSRMTNIAFKYDGFVDKFIGDGLLCFFGDPIHRPDHALRAVKA